MNETDACILKGTKYNYLICSYYDNGKCLSPATREEICRRKLMDEKDEEFANILDDVVRDIRKKLKLGGQDAGI